MPDENDLLALDRAIAEESAQREELKESFGAKFDRLEKRVEALERKNEEMERVIRSLR